MGQQISPTPNPEGAIHTLGDGDYNEGIYQNLGTLVNNGQLTVRSPKGRINTRELNNIYGGTIKNSGTINIMERTNSKHIWNLFAK